MPSLSSPMALSSPAVVSTVLHGGLPTRGWGVIVFGTIAPSAVSTGKPAVNLAVVLDRGSVVFRQTKMLLPTYDVFDEARYFVPADEQKLWSAPESKVALTVCEDAWNDKQFWERRLYERDPVEELVRSGAGILISINA